jgi:hypothetical protein
VKDGGNRKVWLLKGRGRKVDFATPIHRIRVGQERPIEGIMEYKKRQRINEKGIKGWNKEWAIENGQRSHSQMRKLANRRKAITYRMQR